MLNKLKKKGLKVKKKRKNSILIFFFRFASACFSHFLLLLFYMHARKKAGWTNATNQLLSFFYGSQLLEYLKSAWEDFKRRMNTHTPTSTHTRAQTETRRETAKKFWRIRWREREYFPLVSFYMLHYNAKLTLNVFVSNSSYASEEKQKKIFL